MKIPFETFSKQKYQYMDDSLIGQVIPVLYGTVGAIKAQCINDGLDSGNSRTKAVYRLPIGCTDIGTPYVEVDDTFKSASVASVDYNLGLITLNNGRNSSGSTRGLKLTEPTGFVESGHCYPLFVIKDLFTRFQNIVYNSSNFNITNIEAELGNALVEQDIGFLIDDEIDFWEMIYTLSISCGCLFRVYFDKEGRITAKVKDFARASSILVASADVFNSNSLSIQSNRDGVYSSVECKYLKNYYDDVWLSLENTTYQSDVHGKYKKLNKFVVESFIKDESVAESRAYIDATNLSVVPMVTSIDISGGNSIDIWDVITVSLSPDNLNLSSRVFVGNKDCLVLSVSPNIRTGINKAEVLILEGRVPLASQSSVITGTYVTVERPLSSLEIVEQTANDAAAGVSTIQSGAPTDTPDPVENVTVFAYRDFIEVDFGFTGSGLKNSLSGFIIEYTKDGTNWLTAKSISTRYQYIFDRDVDGYPESADFDLWRFRVKAENIYGYVSSTYEPDANGESVNTSQYDTWIPEVPGILYYVNGREAVLNWSDGTQYGLAGYELQIARKTTFPLEADWVKPVNTLNSLTSEDNYTDGSTGFEFVAINTYSQSLPLLGQTTDLPVNTKYWYRIRGVTYAPTTLDPDAVIRSAWSDGKSVVARVLGTGIFRIRNESNTKTIFQVDPATRQSFFHGTLGIGVENVDDAKVKISESVGITGAIFTGTGINDLEILEDGDITGDFEVKITSSGTIRDATLVGPMGGGATTGRDMIWDGSQYIFIQGGRSWSTTDLINFTLHAGVYENYSRIAFNGSVYCWIRDNGEMFSNASLDNSGGVGADFNELLSSITNNGSLFALVSLESGKIFSSPNGYTWTEVTTLNTKNTGITYVNGQYLVCSDDGYIYSSTDLETWVKKGFMSLNGANSFVYVDGYYLASTYKGNTVELTTVETFISQDLMEWTLYESHTVYGASKIVVANNLFLRMTNAIYSSNPTAYQKFQWRKDAGAWSADIDIISGNPVELTGNEITISFFSETGHVLDDLWSFTQDAIPALKLVDKDGVEYLIAEDGAVAGNIHAAKLATPRNINGVAFDGTEDISIDISNTNLVAGNNMYAHMDVWHQPWQYTSYTQSAVYEMTQAGTIRVSFELKSQVSVGNAYGRVYINDVAVGTERTNSTHSIWEIFTEDFDVEVGDVVKIYTKRSGSAGLGIALKNPIILVGNTLAKPLKIDTLECITGAVGPLGTVDVELSFMEIGARKTVTTDVVSANSREVYVSSLAGAVYLNVKTGDIITAGGQLAVWNSTTKVNAEVIRIY